MDQVAESWQGLKTIASLRTVLHRHFDMVQERVTPRQRKAVMAFLQQGQGETYNPEYKPQSGAIFGAIEAMKAAKESEIKAGNEQIELKTNNMAEAGEKAAQAKQDQEQTEASLAADIKFLANLKEQCANIDEEFEQRTKTRNLEMQAVSKALEFLTSEEAQDLVSRTLGLAQRASFAQRLMQAHESKARLQAAQRLDALAKTSHDPR